MSRIEGLASNGAGVGEKGTLLGGGIMGDMTGEKDGEVMVAMWGVKEGGMVDVGTGVVGVTWEMTISWPTSCSSSKAHWASGGGWWMTGLTCAGGGGGGAG